MCTVPAHLPSTETDENNLRALMLADVEVLRRRGGADERLTPEGRAAVRAANIGKKQSPELVAKRVAAVKAAVARRKLISSPANVPPVAKPRRQAKC